MNSRNFKNMSSLYFHMYGRSNAWTFIRSYVRKYNILRESDKAGLTNSPPGVATPGEKLHKEGRGSKNSQLDKGRDRLTHDHMIDDRHADQVKCCLEPPGHSLIRQ